MDRQLELLSAILLVSIVLSILYSVLEPEKVKKLNTWYHILGEKRSSYDFNSTIRRTKYVYYFFAFISALGIFSSFFNQGLGEVFVWFCFVSLIISLYYLYPVKKKSVTNDNNL